MALPDGHRRRLDEYLERCRTVAPELRWVRAESLHLTLRFLGSVEAALLDGLAAGLAAVRWEPFPVAVGGLGSFGRGAAARVVWLGVSEGVSELSALAAAVEDRCAAVGLPPEDRAYSPHLTLARARDRRGARLPELPPPPELERWTVDRFNLYRSRPGTGGAVYSVLAEFPAG